MQSNTAVARNNDNKTTSAVQSLREEHSSVQLCEASVGRSGVSGRSTLNSSVESHFHLQSISSAEIFFSPETEYRILHLPMSHSFIVRRSLIRGSHKETPLDGLSLRTGARSLNTD